MTRTGRIHPNKSVAVCLATYNGERYIFELLRSLESQTYPDFKIYVRDDRSSDDTPNILRKFSTSSRHTYYFFEDEEGNLGPSQNFRTILRNINEDIVFFCDQDDVWHAEKVSKMVVSIEEVWSNTQGILAYCDYNIVDENCELVKAQNINFSSADVRYENSIPGCCMAINNALLKSILQNNSREILHDWLSVLVNLVENGKFIHVEAVLVSYRQHANNVVGAIRRGSIIDRIKSATSFFSTTRKVYSINASLNLTERPVFWRFLINRLAFKLGNILK